MELQEPLICKTSKRLTYRSGLHFQLTVNPADSNANLVAQTQLILTNKIKVQLKLIVVITVCLVNTKGF